MAWAGFRARAVSLNVLLISYSYIFPIIAAAIAQTDGPALCTNLVRAEVRGLLPVHRPHWVRHQVPEGRLRIGNCRAGQEDEDGVNQREHNDEQSHSGEMKGAKGDASERTNVHKLS